MGHASSFLGKIIPQFGRKDPAENFVWRAEDTQHKDVIGKGSTGYVIEAINIKNGQACAIKIIEYEKREDAIFDYAQKKAKLLSSISKLKHPNILKVYNCEPIEVENNFALKHKYAFMMELNSCNLANLIHQKQTEKSLFEEGDLLVNLLQIVAALYEAGKIGVHHHSIKEENIFYDKESQKMLLGDFDLFENLMSKQLDSIYKPPELASDSNNLTEATAYNEKSDIYSLGIVFLKLALLWEGPSSKDKIPMYLEYIKERNYKKLHTVLALMVDLNMSNRPTLEELLQSIQSQICELKGYDYFDEKFSSYLLEKQKGIKSMLEDGNMCKLAEDHKRGIASYQKVINTFTENDSMSKYDRYILSVAHEGLAACYLEAKDFPQAVRHSFKCFKIKTVYLNGFKTYTNLMMVGKIYSRLGDFQNALIYYMKSNEDIKSLADADALTLVKSKENIAYAYENLGDLQSACENYIQASALVQHNFGVNNIKYVNNMKALVRIFKKKGDDDKARLFESKIRDLRI